MIQGSEVLGQPEITLPYAVLFPFLPEFYHLPTYLSVALVVAVGVLMA
jgi:hypothetical protein